MASAIQPDSKTVFLGQLSALVTEVRQVVRGFPSSNVAIADLERSAQDILQAVEHCREEHAALRTAAAAFEEDGKGATLANEGKSLGESQSEIAKKDSEEEGNTVVLYTGVSASSLASESAMAKEGVSPPPPSPSSVAVPAKEGSDTAEEHIHPNSVVMDSSANPIPLASFSSSTPPLLTSSLRSLSLKSDGHGRGEERMRCLPPDQGVGSLTLLDLIQWISKLFLVDPPDSSVIVAALSASTSGSNSGSSIAILNRTPASRLRMLGRNLLQMVQVRCVSALREYLHFVLRMTYSPQGVPTTHLLPTPSSPTVAPSLLSAVQLARAISSTSFALKECVVLSNTLYQPEVVAAAEQIISAGGGRGGAVHQLGGTPAPPSGSSSGNTPDGHPREEEGVGKEKFRKEGSGSASTTPAAVDPPSSTMAIAVLKHARFPLQVAMDVVKEVHKMMRTFASVMEREEYVRSGRTPLHPSSMHPMGEEAEKTLADSAHERVAALEQQWGSSLTHALKEVAPSIAPAVEFLASVAIPLSPSQRSPWSLSLPPSFLSSHSSHTPHSTRARLLRERDRVELVTGSLSVTATTRTSSRPLHLAPPSPHTMTRMTGGRSQSVVVGGTYSSEKVSPTVPPFGVEATLTLSHLLSFPTLLPSSPSFSPVAFSATGRRRAESSATQGEREVSIPPTPTEGSSTNLDEHVSLPPDEKEASNKEIEMTLREDGQRTPSQNEKRQSHTLFIHLVLTQLRFSFIMEILVILANFAVHSIEDSGSSNSSSASGASSLARNGLKEERGVAASRLFSETVREAAKLEPVLLSSMLAAQKQWRNSIFNYILVKFLSLSSKGGGWPAALEDLRALTIAVFTRSPVSGTRAHAITCSEIGLLYTRCIFRFAESPNTPLYVKREIVVHLVQTFLERSSFTSLSTFADRSSHDVSFHSLTSFSPRADATPHIPLLLRMYYCFDLDVHAHSMNVVQQLIAVLCRLVRSSPAAELWKEVEKQAQFPRARKLTREENHDGGSDEASTTTTTSSSSRFVSPDGKEGEQVPPIITTNTTTTTAATAAPPPASPAFLALQGLRMVTDLLKTLQPPENMMEPGTLFFPSSATKEGEACGGEEEPSTVGPSCRTQEASLCKAYAAATLQALREKKQKEQYLADVFNRSSTKAIQRIVTLTPDDTNPPGTEAFSTSWEATKLPPPATPEAEAKINAVANFIWCSPPSSLQLEVVADYITSPNVFSLHVCRNLLRRLPLRGLSLVAALEELLLSFALPKEGQRIERLLEFFCDVYFDANQGPDVDTIHTFPFIDKDACFLVTVATVMLNTSLHNRRVASAMTSKVFCDQLRGCNGEKEFTTNYLEDLYQKIAQHPLHSAFSSPGGSGISSSSFFSLSVSENEEIASKVLDSLFISTEEKKSVSFGLERQRVMAEVHQALYARVMPSPAMPLPEDFLVHSPSSAAFSLSSLPTLPLASSSFLASFQWWGPLQLAKDLFFYSWSSISAVWNPSFYGKVEDPVELLGILPTCLRGLQGLLEVAAAYALPSVTDALLQAMVRIERVSLGARLLFPIQEASRWAVLRIASSPSSIHFSPSCWKVVFHMMSRVRAERQRTLHSNPAPPNGKKGSDGSSGAGPASSTAPVEEEVFARIEAWTTVAEEQEWREREAASSGEKKKKKKEEDEEAEKEGEASLGREKEDNEVEGSAKPIQSVEWKESDEEKSGISSSTSLGKDDTVAGVHVDPSSSLPRRRSSSSTSSRDDGSALSCLRVPSVEEGVHHVLQALMDLLTQEIVAVIGASSAVSTAGQPKEQKAGEGDHSNHSTPDTIVHLLAILERCLCCTKIIRETTWSTERRQDGNSGGTRVLPSIYVDGVHRVVMPSLVVLLEKMMDTSVPRASPPVLSSSETTANGHRAGVEGEKGNAFRSLDTIILPAIGGFLTKVCRLLWVSATRCGSGLETGTDGFPSPPPLDHGKHRTVIPSKEKCDAASSSSSSAATHPTEGAAPLPLSSPVALTEAMFPLLPKCLECFDFFRVVLFHMSQKGGGEVEEDEEEEEEEMVVVMEEGRRASSILWYAVRQHVLQWVGQLTTDTMPSTVSNPSLLAIAALLPSPPMGFTRPCDIRVTPLRSLSFPLYALWHRLLSPLVWMFSPPCSPPPSYLSRFLSPSPSSSSSSSFAMHRPSSSFQATAPSSPSKKKKKTLEAEKVRSRDEKEETHAIRCGQQMEKQCAWQVLVQCVKSCAGSSQFLVDMAAAAHACPAPREASPNGNGHTERTSLAASVPPTSISGAPFHRLAFLLHPPLILLSHMCYLILLSNTPERLPSMEGDVSASRLLVRLLSSLCAAGLSLFHASYPPRHSWPKDVRHPFASPSGSFLSSSSSSSSLPFPTYHQLWMAFVLQMDMAVVGTPVPLLLSASARHPPHEKDTPLVVRASCTAYPIPLLERLCLLLRCEQEDIRGEVLQQLTALVPLLSPPPSVSTEPTHPASSTHDPHPIPRDRSPPGHRAEEEEEAGDDVTTSPPPPSSLSSPEAWQWKNSLHYHFAVLLIRLLQSSTAVLRSAPLSLLSPELVSFWLFLLRDMPPSMRFCSRTAFRVTSLEATLRLLVVDVVSSCPEATRWPVASLVLEHSLTLLIASPCTSLEIKQRTASYFPLCLPFVWQSSGATPAAVQDLVWRCVGWMLTSLRPLTLSYDECPPVPAGAEDEKEGGSGGAVVLAGEDPSALPTTEDRTHPLRHALPLLPPAFLAYLQEAEDVLQVVPLVNWRPVGRKRVMAENTTTSVDVGCPRQKETSSSSPLRSRSQLLLHVNSLLPIDEEGPFDVLCQAYLDGVGSPEKYHTTSSIPSPSSAASSPLRRRASFQRVHPRVHTFGEVPHHYHHHRRTSTTSSSTSLRLCTTGDRPLHVSEGESPRHPPLDPTQDPPRIASSDAREYPTPRRSRRSSSVRPNTSARRHRSPSGGQASRYAPEYYPLLHHVLHGVCLTLEWLSHVSCASDGALGLGTPFSPSASTTGVGVSPHPSSCSSSPGGACETTVVQEEDTALHPPIQVAPDISSLSLLLLLGEVLRTQMRLYPPVMPWRSPLSSSPLEGDVPFAVPHSLLSSSSPSIAPSVAVREALQSYLGVALLCMEGGAEEMASLHRIQRPTEEEKRGSCEVRCDHGNPHPEAHSLHHHDDPERRCTPLLSPPPVDVVSLLCEMFCAWGGVYRRLGEDAEKLSSSSSFVEEEVPMRKGEVAAEELERHAEPREKQTTSSVVVPEHRSSSSSSTRMLSSLQHLQAELGAALVSWIRRTWEIKKWHSQHHKGSSAIASFPSQGYASVGEYLQRFVHDAVCATVVELLPSDVPRPVEGVIKSYLQWYLEQKKEKVLETGEKQEKDEEEKKE